MVYSKSTQFESFISSVDTARPDDACPCTVVCKCTYPCNCKGGELGGTAIASALKLQCEPFNRQYLCQWMSNCLYSMKLYTRSYVASRAKKWKHSV